MCVVTIFRKVVDFIFVLTVVACVWGRIHARLLVLVQKSQVRGQLHPLHVHRFRTARLGRIHFEHIFQKHHQLIDPKRNQESHYFWHMYVTSTRLVAYFEQKIRYVHRKMHILHDYHSQNNIVFNLISLWTQSEVIWLDINKHGSETFMQGWFIDSQWCRLHSLAKITSRNLKAI